MDGSIQELVDIHRGHYLDSFRCLFLEAVEFLLNRLDGLGGVGTGTLHHHGGHACLAVGGGVEAVGETAKLHVGHVAEAENLAVRGGADYYVLEFLFILKASFVAHHVLIALVSVLAELARGRFNVLFGKCGGDVGRHQAVLGHYIRLKPDTHRIVGAEHHGLAHAVDSLDVGNYVDSKIVLYEFLRVLVGIRVYVEHHQLRTLTFVCDDTYLIHFRGEEAGGFGHAVLNVDCRHVRVCARLEIYLDLCRTVVGRRRIHIVHVLGAVDLFLERCDN